MTEVTPFLFDPQENKDVIPPERRHVLIFPREHGAWGILLVPLVTGAASGLHGGASLASLPAFVIAVLALFWLRTPLESRIGSTPLKARSSEEVRLVNRACLGLAAVSAAALVWLFWGWRNLELAWIGAIAAAAFAAQALIRKLRPKARTAAQIIGALGLTSVAAAAFYVVSGRLDEAACTLWGLNFLFAAGQIQFVQLRIRAAHAKTPAARWTFGRNFLCTQLLTVILLTAASLAHVVSWWIPMAFLPVLWRGFSWYGSQFRPLLVHKLGQRELAHAILFGTLLIVAVWLS